MKGQRHPFSGYVYEQDGNGNVLVTADDGRTGRFRIDGKWLEGELKQADPQFCGWIGGPKVTHHRVVDPSQD